MRVSNCTEFEQRLRESVETRTVLDVTPFCDHAAVCDGCRRLWEEYLLLERAVAEWNSDLPVVDLADAVLAQHAFSDAQENESHSTRDDANPAETSKSSMEAELETRPKLHIHSATSRSTQMRTSGRRNSALAALTAASLALFLIAAPFNPSTVYERLADGPLTETRAASTQDIAGVDATGADVEALVRDAGFAYLELARDAAEVFTDTVVFIPEVTLPTAVPADALDSNSDDFGRSIPWGQELDPIRRDVGQAIDFLFETILTDSTETEPAT